VVAPEEERRQAFDSLVKEEPKRFMAECKEASTGWSTARRRRRASSTSAKSLATYRTAWRPWPSARTPSAGDALGSADPGAREGGLRGVAKNDLEILRR